MRTLAPSALRGLVAITLLVGFGASPAVAVDVANDAPFAPWVIDLSQAEAVVAAVEGGAAERVDIVLQRHSIGFRTIVENGMIVLDPEEPVNAVRVDHILIRTVVAAGGTRLVTGLISTYGGSFIVSESWNRDGSYRGGVVAAIDGSLVDEWQPADQIDRDFHHFLVAANRAMSGQGPQSPDVPSQGSEPAAPALRGWVITIAEARDLLESAADSATVTLELDGHVVEFMPLRDEELLVLTPVDPGNPARVDNIMVELWTDPTANPPAISGILSTYAGTIVIRENYDRDEVFTDGLVARIDGRLLRAWAPPDQYQVTLDELLALAGEPANALANADAEDAVRGGGGNGTPSNPLLIGLGGAPIDDGATDEGTTGVVSDVGGI